MVGVSAVAPMVKREDRDMPETHQEQSENPRAMGAAATMFYWQSTASIQREAVVITSGGFAWPSSAALQAFATRGSTGAITLE